MPSILWVQFDHPSTGSQTRRENKYHEGIDQQWTPIFMVNRNFNTGTNYVTVTRKQFPLRPAAAKTIHKAQGDTVDEIVVDMEGTFGQHSHYVALSRVTKKSGLHIKNLNERKIRINKDVVNEMERLRTEARLQLCYVPVYAMDSSTFTFVFHNVRSLHRHFIDVAADPNYASANIVAVAESRLVHSDNDEEYALPGFYIIRNDQIHFSQQQHRPPHGLVLYIKEHLKVLDVSCVSAKQMEYIAIKFEYGLNNIHFVVPGTCIRGIRGSPTSKGHIKGPLSGPHQAWPR